MSEHKQFCEGNVCASCCLCDKCGRKVGTRHLDVCACGPEAKHWLCGDCRAAFLADMLTNSNRERWQPKAPAHAESARLLREVEALKMERDKLAQALADSVGDAQRAEREVEALRAREQEARGIIHYYANEFDGEAKDSMQQAANHWLADGEK